MTGLHAQELHRASPVNLCQRRAGGSRSRPRRDYGTAPRRTSPRLAARSSRRRRRRRHRPGRPPLKTRLSRPLRMQLARAAASIEAPARARGERRGVRAAAAVQPRPPGCLSPGMLDARAVEEQVGGDCARWPPVITRHSGRARGSPGRAIHASLSRTARQSALRPGPRLRQVGRGDRHARQELRGGRRARPRRAGGRRSRRSSRGRAPRVHQVERSSASATASIVAVAEHADLDRVDPDVPGHRRDLGDDDLGGSGWTRSLPTVFCAVIAVIAVIPCAGRGEGLEVRLDAGAAAGVGAGDGENRGDAHVGPR